MLQKIKLKNSSEDKSTSEPGQKEENTTLAQHKHNPTNIETTQTTSQTQALNNNMDTDQLAPEGVPINHA